VAGVFKHGDETSGSTEGRHGVSVAYIVTTERLILLNVPQQCVAKSHNGQHRH
jgi:hypothetical protein